MFQYGRFTNLAMTISEKETLTNILADPSESVAVKLEQQSD